MRKPFLERKKAEEQGFRKSIMLTAAEAIKRRPM